MQTKGPHTDIDTNTETDRDTDTEIGTDTDIDTNTNIDTGKDITETKHQAKKKFKTNGEILLLHQYCYVFKKYYVMATINLTKVTP